MDIPLPWLSERSVRRGVALSRAPQVHQLLCSGVWIFAATEHAVPSRFYSIQDPHTSWQTKVFQIHMIDVIARCPSDNPTT